jgi:hypothetical protein
MFTQNNQPTQHMNKNKKNTAFKLARSLAVAAAIAAPLAVEAAPVLQNMDFGGQAGSASGAAILGQAGDFWTMYQPGGNEQNLEMFTSVPGYNSVGSSLSLAGWGGTYGGSSYGVSGQIPLTGDYLYATSPTASMTIDGLTAGDNYTWVFYLNQGGVSRPLSITVGGTTLSTSGVVNKTALVEGVNYLTFQGVIGQSELLVANFAFAPGNVGEMDVNGFQLQTVVPEPATYAMVLGGIATLLLIRRRVQA